MNDSRLGRSAGPWAKGRAAEQINAGVVPPDGSDAEGQKGLSLSRRQRCDLQSLDRLHRLLPLLSDGADPQTPGFREGKGA